ncbi:MAG: hypothetical protein QMD50_03470 [Patescibacteria group bacterium]|nr:hypothetical protein [Patescibacteria group bacterium]
MKVEISDKKETFTLIPETIGEYGDLCRLSSLVRPDENLIYAGRRGPIPEEYLENIPGLKEKNVKPCDSMTLRFKFDNDFIFEITDEIVKNNEGVDFIRNIAWSTHKIIFLGVVNLKGNIEANFTAGYCKICNNLTVDPAAILFMCDECVQKCVHEYEFSWKRSDDFKRLILVERCDKCGRINPDFDADNIYSSEEQARILEGLLNISVKSYADLPDLITDLKKGKE